MTPKLLATFALLAFVTGCGQAATDDGPMSKNQVESETSVVESALSGANASLDDSEQYTATACSTSRFTPLLGSVDCLGTEKNQTIIMDYRNCSVGPTILSGTIKLSFDNPNTCTSWINGGTLPSSGTLTRTSSSVRATFTNGTYVLTDSLSHQNYMNHTISGGIKTTFGPTGLAVEILGIHRVGRSSGGLRFFDHSLRTTAPIVATGYRFNGTREISSGTIRVDHNLASFTTSIDLAGLKWSAACCHPTDGQISYDLTGSLAGHYTVDFNTGVCGKIHVTKQGQSPTDEVLSVCD